MILTLLIALNNRSASCAPIGVRVGVGTQLGRGADFLGRSRAHSRKIALQRDAKLTRRCLLEHLDENAQLDPVGMGFDRPGFRRKRFRSPGEVLGLGARRLIVDFTVRVGDGRLANVIVHRAAPLLVNSNQLDLDPRSMRRLPVDHLVRDHLRGVLARVDLDLVIVSRLSWSGPRSHHDRFAGREQSVHARRRDSDSLLAPSLLQDVKLGTVQELPEDLWDLCLHDSGAVVLDCDAKPILGELLDVDFQHGKDSGLFAGVERIINRFLDRGQERLLRIVKSRADDGSW